MASITKKVPGSLRGVGIVFALAFVLGQAYKFLVKDGEDLDNREYIAVFVAAYTVYNLI